MDKDTKGGISAATRCVDGRHPFPSSVAAWYHCPRFLGAAVSLRELLYMDDD